MSADRIKFFFGIVVKYIYSYLVFSLAAEFVVDCPHKSHQADSINWGIQLIFLNICRLCF